MVTFRYKKYRPAVLVSLWGISDGLAAICLLNDVDPCSDVLVI